MSFGNQAELTSPFDQSFSPAQQELLAVDVLYFGPFWAGQPSESLWEPPGF